MRLQIFWLCETIQFWEFCLGNRWAFSQIWKSYSFSNRSVKFHIFSSFYRALRVKFRWKTFRIASKWNDFLFQIKNKTKTEILFDVKIHLKLSSNIYCALWKFSHRCIPKHYAMDLTRFMNKQRAKQRGRIEIIIKRFINDFRLEF